MAASSAIKLYTGARLPMLGLGTYWRVPYAYTMGGKLLPLKSEEYKKTAYECTKAAISAGYRHIDTAFAYENEEEVGRAIKDKILDKTVKRTDMFVTGKLWATHHHPEDVRPAVLNSLKNLGLDYLDMYLIHTPWAFRNPGDGTLFPRDRDGNLFFDDIDYTVTWKAMESLVEDGVVKGIGLSNFNMEQTQRVINKSSVQPAVMQMELHPYLSQEEMVKFCKDHKIAITAFSSFGAPDSPIRKDDDPRLFDDGEIKALAESYEKTPAQIILRYLVQQRISVVPKSSNPDRIKENTEIFDFKLSDDDMTRLDVLNKNWRALRYESVKKHKFYPFTKKTSAEPMAARA
ncbi:aldo-keto reductase family 1 member B1-like [Branchiostoma floridae x Branchiostoma belcheri]